MAATTPMLTRDDWGIPTIVADDLDGLFYGQGLAVAQDRLWHLEWDRRRALGTLAEITGIEGHAVTDAFARRARLADAARRGYDSLDLATKAALDAHAAGVNEWIARGEPLPLELASLGCTPSPFDGWHAVATFLIRHVNFANWQTKLWRARVLCALGPEALHRFGLEGLVGDTPVIVPPGARAAVGELEAAGLLDGDDQATAERAAMFDPSAPAVAALDVLGLEPLGLQQSGSNCWVVGGTRTATGRPIVAGDPHRAFEVPNVYYQVRLRCDAEGIDAAGFTFPGVPGIQHFGQTQHLAWGVTNAAADYQDLFVERLPEAAVDVRTEVVHVRDRADVVVECSRTRHGPVVVGSAAHGVGVALASTGLDDPAGSLRTLLPLLRARTAGELDRALDAWVEPINNWVMADTAGSIAYRTAGKVPVRTPVNTWLPVPGWVDDHDWHGTIPDAELPRTHDPELDAIVTANQRVTTPDYPHLLGYDCYGPARAQRIWDRIDTLGRGTATTSGHAAIHTDAQSLAGRIFAARSGHPVLATWDASMSADSAGAALYAIARDHLVRRVASFLPEQLRTNPFRQWEPPATALALEHRVANAIDGWIEADDTFFLPTGVSWDGEISAAVDAAVEELSARFGDDPSAWSWGAIHELTPVHPLAAALGDEVRPRSGPISGGSACVMATNQIGGITTMGMVGSTARYAWDLADRSQSGWIVPLGASGAPSSPHFADQTAGYVIGALVPVWPTAHAGVRSMPDVRTSDERTMLVQMLDWYRDGVRLKVRGLTDAQAATSQLPGGMAIAGLVKHLALVEDTWFTTRFAGRPDPEPWASAPFDDDPDWDFHSGATDGISRVLGLYDHACERSRAVTATHALDDISAVPSPKGPFTLRWGLLHLVEETARHLGHLDLLRELTDGVTGE